MNKHFTDQEMLDDALSSQKFITGSYNRCANECASPALKTEFMNLLSEEHRIQHELFAEMLGRGWYQTFPAPQDKISQVKQKYQPLQNS